MIKGDFRIKRCKNSMTHIVFGMVLILMTAVILPANSIRVSAKEEPVTLQDSSEDKLLREYYERKILPAYGMADLSTKTRAFDYDSEREIRWTETIGIASAELCDLDTDGKDELFLAVLEEKRIRFSVYEVENGAVIKKTEAYAGRYSDMAAYEEILTLIHTEQGNYILLTQNASGVMEDFYDADILLYRYDGGTLYLDMAIWQMSPGSDELEYAACHYTNQGKLLSEELICGTDRDGTYLNSEHQSKHMKELFAEYGIETCEQPDMRGSLKSLVSGNVGQKVLMELSMWNSSNYIHDEKRTEEIYHFNEAQYILPESNSMYLTEENLAGLSQGELRLARNEIYARHDLIFQDKTLTDYFMAKGYYHPINKTVPDTALNQYEIANRNLLISMENRNN